MQACGALPEDNPLKGYDYYANYINAPLLYARATEYGLPASIVQLAPIMAYLDSSFSVRGFFVLFT